MKPGKGKKKKNTVLRETRKKKMRMTEKEQICFSRKTKKKLKKSEWGGEDGAIALMRVLLQPKSLFLKRVKHGVEKKEVKKKKNTRKKSRDTGRGRRKKARTTKKERKRNSNKQVFVRVLNGQNRKMVKSEKSLNETR